MCGRYSYHSPIFPPVLLLDMWWIHFCCSVVSQGYMEVTDILFGWEHFSVDVGSPENSSSAMGFVVVFLDTEIYCLAITKEESWPEALPGLIEVVTWMKNKHLLWSWNCFWSELSFFESIQYVRNKKQVEGGSGLQWGGNKKSE